MPKQAPEPVPILYREKRNLDKCDDDEKELYFEVRALRVLIKEDLRAIFNTENQFLLPSQAEERWVIERIKEGEASSEVPLRDALKTLPYRPHRKGSIFARPITTTYPLHLDKKIEEELADIRSKYAKLYPMGELQHIQNRRN